MTTVVHVRDVLDRLKAGDPQVVYIGRANGRYGLKKSPWANPFRIGLHANREQAIQAYREWLLIGEALGFARTADLLQRLPELRGKALACWCAPAACHGDVLAELAEALG